MRRFFNVVLNVGIVSCIALTLVFFTLAVMWR